MYATYHCPPNRRARRPCPPEKQHSGCSWAKEGYQKLARKDRRRFQGTDHCNWWHLREGPVYADFILVDGWFIIDTTYIIENHGQR